MGRQRGLLQALEDAKAAVEEKTARCNQLEAEMEMLRQQAAVDVAAMREQVGGDL